MQPAQRTAIEQLKQIFEPLPVRLVLVDETILHCQFQYSDCRLNFELGTLCFALCFSIVSMLRIENKEQSSKLKVQNEKWTLKITNRECWSSVYQTSAKVASLMWSRGCRRRSNQLIQLACSTLTSTPITTALLSPSWPLPILLWKPR